MMGHREKLKGGEEWDAFSKRARRWLLWRPGELRKIKRGFSKRVRKQVKNNLAHGGDD